MNIKTDLLKGYITEFINSHINDFGIDADKITDSVAIKALAEIQGIIKNDDLDDFEIVEEIVCIFEKYNIDAGGCHDF